MRADALRMTDKPAETRCEECAYLKGLMRAAIVAYDRSAETDARVLLRRHMRVTHQQELPYPW